MNHPAVGLVNKLRKASVGGLRIASDTPLLDSLRNCQSCPHFRVFQQYLQSNRPTEIRLPIVSSWPGDCAWISLVLWGFSPSLRSSLHYRSVRIVPENEHDSYLFQSPKTLSGSNSQYPNKFPSDIDPLNYQKQHACTSQETPYGKSIPLRYDSYVYIRSLQHSTPQAAGNTTQRDLTFIMDRLNTRPRKLLDYATPSKVYSKSSRLVA